MNRQRCTTDGFRAQQASVPDSEHAALVKWLLYQYPEVRVLPDGSIAALYPLLTTTSVILGLTRWGYAKRFCYHARADAERVLRELQSEDDEPEGWVARR